MASTESILIIRPDNIGDVVMTGPAMRAIRQTFPDSRITLLAGSSGAQAAPLLPWLDDVLISRVLWQDLGRLAFDPVREEQLIERIRCGRFSRAFIFTSFSQTPLPAALVCYLAGVPERIGCGKEDGGGLLTSDIQAFPDDLHQVERNLRIVEAAGIAVKDRSLELSVTRTMRAKALELLRRPGGAPSGGFILLAPWASCEARTFDTHRFATAARLLADGLGLPVVVTGAAIHEGLAGKVMEALGEKGLDLVGRTTIPELAALVMESRLVLTTHTLTMHLADAFRRPSVTAFSGSDLECQWRPRHSPFVVLRRPTDCTPCYNFVCPRDRACMDIPAQEVAEAGLEVLKSDFGFRISNVGF